ncbi:MAG: MerR family transcriptional regulator [Gemmatimonadaceae bacterium]
MVAERTGLSRDVLRVWERRYAAVEPTRTPGGQRLYSNEQIDRFRLLAAATKHGRNISLVAGLGTDALERLVAEDEAERPAPLPESGEASHVELVRAVLELTRALDGSALDRELRRTMARHGLPVFLEAVVPTLMYRVGEEWRAGRLTIAHEHLASAAVLAIILEAMRAVPESSGAPRLLVATPAGERHAIGAALAAAAAALDGWSIVYLGVDVPAADIVAAAAASNASAVALSIVHTDDPDAAIRELHAVRASLAAHVPVIVGGATAVHLAGRLTEPGLMVCGSLAEMRRVLPCRRPTA